MGKAVFSGALSKKGFPQPLPSQLFFSCCPLFKGVTRTLAQGRWITGVFPCTLGWLGRTEPLPQAVRLLRAAQRTEWEVWRPFTEAAFSSLTPLLIDSRFWRNSCGPNQMPERCCQKPLLPPFSPLLPLVTGTFLPLLRFSLPIPITSFSLLCPLLLFILPRREKEGALTSQLFTCKYFLYFCPDLAKFGVLREQATESLLFPSGILAASFLASEAVYNTKEKMPFFHPSPKLVS